MFKKAATATIAALTIAGTIAMSSAPAQAKFGRNGAFIGGVAAALIGGAILSHAHRSHYRGYRDCWTEKRARYNRWGDFRGYRYIRVCN